MSYIAKIVYKIITQTNTTVEAELIDSEGIMPTIRVLRQWHKSNVTNAELLAVRNELINFYTNQWVEQQSEQNKKNSILDKYKTYLDNRCENLRDNILQQIEAGDFTPAQKQFVCDHLKITWSIE